MKPTSSKLYIFPGTAGSPLSPKVLVGGVDAHGMQIIPIPACSILEYQDQISKFVEEAVKKMKEKPDENQKAIDELFKLAKGFPDVMVNRNMNVPNSVMELSNVVALDLTSRSMEIYGDNGTPSDIKKRADFITLLFHNNSVIIRRYRVGDNWFYLATPLNLK